MRLQDCNRDAGISDYFLGLGFIDMMGDSMGYLVAHYEGNPNLTSADRYDSGIKHYLPPGEARRINGRVVNHIKFPLVQAEFRTSPCFAVIQLHRLLDFLPYFTHHATFLGARA